MSEAPGRAKLSTRAALIALATLCLIWGSTWLVIKRNVDDVPPLTAAAARLWVAGLTMLALAPWLRRVEGGNPPPWWLWVPFGLTQFSTSFAVIYAAGRHLPSGLSAVLWAIYPLLMALGSHLFLPTERLRGAQWSGFVFGFVGIVSLFQTDLRQAGPEAVPAGLLLMTSPLMVAAVTIAIKRHGSGVSAMLLNRNAMLLGAIVLTIGALAIERDAEIRYSGEALFCIVYLALVGTVMTFGIYFWLMRHLPANRLALIAYVTPAIALSMGATIGAEPLYWHTFVGFGLILFGVLLASGRIRLSR